MRMSSSDNNVIKISPPARHSDPKNKNAESIAHDLVSRGLKMVPIEKSASLKSKRAKSTPAGTIKKKANGKLMPHVKQLEELHEDSEHKSETIPVFSADDKIKENCEKRDEEIDGSFGTDALNVRHAHSESQDELTYAFRFSNARNNTLLQLDGNRNNKYSMSEKSKISRSEPCTCAESDTCNKRGHKRHEKKRKCAKNNPKSKFPADSDQLMLGHCRIDSEMKSALDEVNRNSQSNTISVLPEISHNNAENLENNPSICLNIPINVGVETGKTETGSVEHFPEVVPFVDNCCEDINSSNSTIIYSLDVESSPFHNIAAEKSTIDRSFSPIPSTSRDNATFEINNQKFIYSLGKEQSTNTKVESNTLITGDDVQLANEQADIKIENSYEGNTLHIDGKLQPTEGHFSLKGLNDTPKSILQTAVTISHQSEVKADSEVHVESTVKKDTIDNLLEMINVDDSDDSQDDCVAVDVDTILSQNNSILRRFKPNNTNTSTKSDSDVVCIDDFQCELNLQDVYSENVNNDIPPTYENNENLEPDNFSFKELLKNIVAGLCNSPKTNSALSVFGLNPAALKEIFCSETTQTTENDSEETQAQMNYVRNVNTMNKKRKFTPKLKVSKKAKIIDTIDLVHSRDSPKQTHNLAGNEIITIDLDASCSCSQNLTKSEQSSSSHIPSDYYHYVSNPSSTPKPPSPPKSGLSGDCPVCLESFASKSMASTLCGHLFCLSCLKIVMKTSKRCPTCRKVIKKNGYHQIFI